MCFTKLIKMLKKIAIIFPNNSSHGEQDTPSHYIPQQQRQLNLSVLVYCLDTSRKWNKKDSNTQEYLYRNNFLDPYLVHEYTRTSGTKNAGDKDWFFDTFILGDTKCSHSSPTVSFTGLSDTGAYNAPPVLNSVPGNKVMWQNFFIDSLNSNGSMYAVLQNLNDSIDMYKQQIGDPNFKHKWMITIPTAISRTRDSSGRIRNIINNPSTRTFDKALIKYYEAGYADGGRWPLTINSGYQTNALLLNMGAIDQALAANSTMTDEQLVDVVKKVIDGTYDVTASQEYPYANVPIKCQINSANAYVQTAYGVTHSGGEFNIDLNYWGTITENGTDVTLDFSKDEDILKALKWYVDAVQQKVVDLNETFPNLEFSGFCMACEDPTFLYSVPVINGIQSYIQDLGYKLIVSPYPSYYNQQAIGHDETYSVSFPTNRIRNCNFDNVYFQINRALSENNEDLSQDIAYINKDNLDINIASSKNTYKNQNTIDRLNTIVSTLNQNDMIASKNIMCYEDDGAFYEVVNDTSNVYQSNAKATLDNLAYSLIATR